jgi:hypothetical protein
MQATLQLRQPSNLKAEKTPSASLASSEANSVAVEIHSYLAARNLLLREAEKNTTEINLRRVAAANAFAENCLRPGRSPYETQALPEEEAERERRHCQSVKLRLAELRARAGLRRRAA